MSVQGTTNGVVVSEVDDGSYAQQLNLQRGDIILAVNDQKIGTTRDLEKRNGGARLLLEDHAGARRAGVHHRDRRLTRHERRSRSSSRRSTTRKRRARLPRAALAAKLAACVQIHPVRSHYVWKGEMREEPEFLLHMKARARRLSRARRTGAPSA